MAKKGKGKAKLPGGPKARRAARAAGKVAYGPQLRDSKQAIAQGRAHRRVIDQAYAAYANRLGEIGQAQQGQMMQARQGTLDAARELGVVGRETAGAGAAEAQRRAALLGQGSSVADVYTQLGESSALSRADAALLADRGMADLGIAFSTDLGRRQATGARDRIRAREDHQKLIGGLQDQRADIRREKGAFQAQTAFEYAQQLAANKIAREGLKLQARELGLEGRMQRRSARQESRKIKQKKQERIVNRQQKVKDRKLKRQELKAQGKSGKVTRPNKLSPAKRQEYRQKKSKLGAVVDTYRNARKRGMDPKAAKARARRGTGGERWMAAVASQLVDKGRLSPRGKKMVRGYLPGGYIPRNWR